VRVRSDNPFVVTLAAMLREQSHLKASLASLRTALKLPQLSPYSLLTLALLVSIATVDIVLTPTLHVGVFLYPISILTALWWVGNARCST
jgi:hypothetical protein